MKEKAIICDLDGTLASCEWRRHHVSPIFPDRHKNWPAFFDGINADAPVPFVIEILERCRKAGFKIILTTARPDSYRYHTEWWLNEHNIKYNYMFMRRAGDARLDHVVKEEIYRQKIEPNFEIQLVVDDRPSVCDKWRELGLHVVQVEDPNIPPIYLEE